MNETSSSNPISSLKKIEWTPQRIKIAAIVALLLVVYLLLRPWLSSALGIELPGLFPDQQAVQVDPQKPVGDGKSNGQVADAGASGKSDVGLPEAESPTVSKSTGTTKKPGGSSTSANSPKSTTGTKSTAPPAGNSTRDNTSVASGTGTKPTVPSTGTQSSTKPPSTGTSATGPTTPATPKTPANGGAKPKDPKPETQKPQPVLGELTDIGRGALKSTAGLVYRPAYKEHRVEHVLLHAVDDPNKPVHGVFDGKREEILALIDEAYLKAQKARPPTVTIEDDGDRTVYVIDLGRKIGYMGGEVGKRKKFPPCKHLQIVLEGTDVITAFPVIPR